MNRLQRGEPPVIDGKGEQSMDFIHVHDIARATVLALESEQDNQPVNIGTGIAPRSRRSPGSSSTRSARRAAAVQPA